MQLSPMHKFRSYLEYKWAGIKVFKLNYDFFGVFQRVFDTKYPIFSLNGIFYTFKIEWPQMRGNNQSKIQNQDNQENNSRFKRFFDKRHESLTSAD